MKILNCIAHQVHTEQHKKEVAVTERDNELVVTDSLITLVDDVLKTYRKESNLAYGDFKLAHSFPEKLTEFLEGKINFVDFSKRMVAELSTWMTVQPLSTGGYLLFIHYQETSNYLLVVMLKEAAGLSFNDKLELQDIERLELDKLHFAARINFVVWLAKEHEVSQQRYVSFLKGASRKVVTEYFKSFLGIDDSSYVDQRDNTRALKNAIKEFSKENKWDSAREHGARTAVRDYGYSQEDKGEPIDLQVIANIMTPEDPNAFIEFSNKESIKLQGNIRLSRDELRTFTRLAGKNKLMTITIEQEALEGEKPSAVWNNGILTINDVPKKLRDALDDYSGE